MREAIPLLYGDYEVVSCAAAIHCHIDCSDHSEIAEVAVHGLRPVLGGAAFAPLISVRSCSSAVIMMWSDSRLTCTREDAQLQAPPSSPGFGHRTVGSEESVRAIRRAQLASWRWRAIGLAPSPGLTN